MNPHPRSTHLPDRLAAGRATARSAVYAALSALLAADEAGVEALRSRVLPSLAGAGSGSEAVERTTATLEAVLSQNDTAELLRSHRGLLPPVESAQLPACESVYSGSDIFRQAQHMADIAGFYRAHGLVVGGSRRERPDHISVELEFMALLAAKEADALLNLGPDQIQMSRHAQALFLADHLGRWSPVFARRLAEQATGGPFQSVAEALAGWIASELSEHGVTALPPDPPPDPLPIVSVGGADPLAARGVPE